VPPVATVTFFHAHPDDEAIITGGTMASLAAEGHRVVLVTATRGDLGEVPEGFLAENESVADRRQVELAAAGVALGVERQDFLDYLDSGMAGETTNGREGSFAGADLDEAAARLARILREEASDVLVVYDDHGGYGHPDHIQVHRVGLRAADIAGTPVVYLSTIDRDHVRELIRASEGTDWSMQDPTPEDLDSFGEPAERITTAVDVTKWLGAKREAMRAHASQISEESFFLALPDEAFAMVWGTEWYIRDRPEYEGPPGSRETALVLDSSGRS
jgi:LmbE family N-acetylglucosaminyl deacetylase